MKYIEISHITKCLKKNTVLNDISLSLDKGNIHGFQGINGSGKTMLFRAILGLIKLDKGEIYINQKKLQTDEIFPVSAGVLIENPGFIEEFSAFKNLKLLASIQGPSNKESIDTVLEMVGLNPKDERKVKKYSLGMKQKLGIAQAILGSPELLILDEPTNALDEESVNKLCDLLLKYKLEGKTILVSSHDKDFLKRISDQIIKINQGQIVI
ncbi:ATP-binding cassette domain-containing protein [Bacillus pseudomycoides]|uniref:ATP-binding cassette domain-containing protein n=1 Tax=Bacillus TaxID=1386 RepID=UPI0022492BC9|nr:MULTISPECIES: ATP-binding cassette domain-containing protein [Bacillus]MCX2829661.1 ATP-binding cassette domain-containing protein [Bacillus sp. DHT2]MDR4919085.1 ATP-binding cassette domain-containing protein [Bacillus pseudomycoides]